MLGFTIALLVLLSLDVYAFQAFRVLFADALPMLKWTAYGSYFLVSILVFGFFYFFGYLRWSPDLIGRNTFNLIRAGLMIAFLAKLVLFLFLFFEDAVRGVQWLISYFQTESVASLKGRSKFLSTVAILAAGIPFLTLSYGILRNAYRYKYHKIKLGYKDLPDALEGLKIVQISDIHSGSFTQKDPIKLGIEMINEVSPDLVFFTGDLVNSLSEEVEPYIDIFSKIKAKYGVYSITGNHDYGDYARLKGEEKEANFNQLIKHHQAMGWDILLNENREIDVNGKKLSIIGVENTSASEHFNTYGDLAKASKGSENADFKILLSHDPTHWDLEVNSKYQDISLMLSGHTHGAQFGIEIPGWIKWSPAKYIYKQWAGLYKKGSQYLYVNRGFGFLGYPGRVGILPEITVLELTKTA